MRRRAPKLLLKKVDLFALHAQCFGAALILLLLKEDNITHFMSAVTVKLVVPSPFCGIHKTHSPHHLLPPPPPPAATTLLIPSRP